MEVVWYIGDRFIFQCEVHDLQQVGRSFAPCKTVKHPICLVVWNMCFIFPFSWECHNPNWPTRIFQRGRSTTNQQQSSNDHPGLPSQWIGFLYLDDRSWYHLSFGQKPPMDPYGFLWNLKMFCRFWSAPRASKYCISQWRLQDVPRNLRQRKKKETDEAGAMAVANGAAWPWWLNENDSTRICASGSIW